MFSPQEVAGDLDVAIGRLGAAGADVEQRRRALQVTSGCLRVLRGYRNATVAGYPAKADQGSWFKTRADAELGPTPAGTRSAFDDFLRPDRRVGRRRLAEVDAAGALRSCLDWTPLRLVHQLISRVRRVHAGEVKRLGGPGGLSVEAVEYVDRRGHGRRGRQTSGTSATSRPSRRSAKVIDVRKLGRGGPPRRGVNRLTPRRA